MRAGDDLADLLQRLAVAIGPLVVDVEHHAVEELPIHVAVHARKLEFDAGDQRSLVTGAAESDADLRRFRGGQGLVHGDAPQRTSVACPDRRAASEALRAGAPDPHRERGAQALQQGEAPGVRAPDRPDEDEVVPLRSFAQTGEDPLAEAEPEQL